ATPIGEGGISIIRVSGENALEIVNKIFRGANLNKVASHTIHYGHIIDYANKDVVDEVLELFIELGADDDQLDFPV
ncbi:hypothetical protein QP357_30115, partial [Klebsiella pneumoniae]|nr:hypothetical protein [Klebsiella pneumoniae]